MPLAHTSPVQLLFLSDGPSTISSWPHTERIWETNVNIWQIALLSGEKLVTPLEAGFSAGVMSMQRPAVPTVTSMQTPPL
ncbi:hypothetical protein PHLCEN_2v2326 [Hermanssonia centrifuga]|uniref:Uncharacterized protein n=1 Tax=Hermanssonia centrifuga TaxID=98765 RepID=A0A2R6RPK4_9APHY|nr:hypothetical protein PHLCEN_2v2326 [Hermanssonia centrifuga]